MGKGALTKNAVVDRALALSTQVGLEGLSIGKLAADLKLSKSGLFAHFQSKEALEIAVVERAAERFADLVVFPAIAAPFGVARLEALFAHWSRWPELAELPGGCFFIAAAAELDDREGPVREELADQLRELGRTIERFTADAIRASEFRADVDPAQFSFELFGIIFSLHQSLRLLRDDTAHRRARTAFDALVMRSRRVATSLPV